MPQQYKPPQKYHGPTYTGKEQILKMQQPVFLLPVPTFKWEQSLNQTAFLSTNLKVQRFHQLLGPQDQTYLGLAHLVTDAVWSAPQLTATPRCMSWQWCSLGRALGRSTTSFSVQPAVSMHPAMIHTLAKSRGRQSPLKRGCGGGRRAQLPRQLRATASPCAHAPGCTS